MGGTGSASGHAVVKIPDVPSSFYDNTNNEIYVNPSSLQELMFFYKDTVVANENLEWVSNNETQIIVAASQPADSPNPSSVGQIGYKYSNAGNGKYIYPIINLPTSVIFAELQITSTGMGMPIPISVPLSKNGDNAPVIDTAKYASQQFTGFDPESIKAGNPGYAYLRFTTAEHTYSATIQITYENGAYKPDIII